MKVDGVGDKVEINGREIAGKFSGLDIASFLILLIFIAFPAIWRWWHKRDDRQYMQQYQGQPQEQIEQGSQQYEDQYQPYRKPLAERIPFLGRKGIPGCYMDGGTFNRARSECLKCPSEIRRDCSSAKMEAESRGEERMRENQPQHIQEMKQQLGLNQNGGRPNIQVMTQDQLDRERYQGEPSVPIQPSKPFSLTEGL